MKTLIATLVAAAVLAPMALAGGAPAPTAADAKKASAACKAARTADATAWSTFAAKYQIVGKADFAAAFGKSAKNGKTPLGKCRSFVARQLAAARKAAKAPAATTTTTTAAAVTSNEDWCKVELAKAGGSSYKNLGECLKDKAGK